ncbi:MAG: proline dehydrogenase family protein [Bacteroidales bacterium]
MKKNYIFVEILNMEFQPTDMNTEHNKIDFNNSEISFKNKSNKELREAYLLFRVMNNPTLVRMGKHLVNFAFTIHFPVKGIIRNTIYKYFVGGSSIEDCAKSIEKLKSRNVGTILDYAAEGEQEEAFFNTTCDEVIKTIEYAHTNKSIPFSVFKITGLGRFDLFVKISQGTMLSEEETKEYERVENRVKRIFEMGYKNNIPILVDAEETWIQPMLDDLVNKNMEIYNKTKAIVQNTYQMYRHDSIERLKEHHKMALEKNYKFGLKIVRGAYMEKERKRAHQNNYPSPIQPDKASTDNDFNEIIKYLIENIDTIDFMVATHNEESSELLANLIDKLNLPKNHPSIYFAQLYGMSDHITNNLAEKGYNVVKYVPYGEVKTMMPYLFRRAEENSSVKGQTSRELRLIEKELKRRKE